MEEIDDFDEEEINLTDKKSDYFKIVEILQSDKNLDKKVIIPKRKYTAFNKARLIYWKTRMPLVKGLIDDSMSLTISLGGQGRKDIVDMTKTSIAKTLTYEDQISKGKKRIRKDD